MKDNKKLFRFILSCVPNYADAEDILQEIAAVLWSKFDEFDPESNFYAWAKQTAKYKISYYYRQKKDVWKFDEDVLENILTVNDALEKNSDKRMTALQGCLGRLDSRDINLIKVRYQEGVSVRQIAEKTDISVSMLYKRLACVYAILRDCILKTLMAWETGQ